MTRLLTGVSIQALAPIGGVFGGLLSGPIADRWGRKDALVLCGIPSFIGYLTLSYAHYMPTALGFKALALTGRFLTGVGMGWACMAGPVSYKSMYAFVRTVDSLNLDTP